MPLEREQPARSNWLQDGGLGEDNLYNLCCSICSTKVAACKFQSRAQNIKTHEASQLHQRAALKWQEIQDRRGVLQPARPPPPPIEPAPPLISERAARQRRREAAEDANPAAASSSAESDSEPEPALLPSPALSAQEFWREATRLGAQLHFGAWVKLAELAMVMVPGSVENERMFSTLKYIRNPQRNKLQAQHLTCCARGFRSSAFSVENFPYPEAIMEWLSAKKRRGIR